MYFALKQKDLTLHFSLRSEMREENSLRTQLSGSDTGKVCDCTDWMSENELW